MDPRAYHNSMHGLKYSVPQEEVLMAATPSGSMHIIWLTVTALLVVEALMAPMVPEGVNFRNVRCVTILVPRMPHPVYLVTMYGTARYWVSMSCILTAQSSGGRILTPFWLMIRQVFCLVLIFGGQCSNINFMILSPSIFDTILVGGVNFL
jgi:hypothetical protein